MCLSFKDPVSEQRENNHFVGNKGFLDSNRSHRVDFCFRFCLQKEAVILVTFLKSPSVEPMSEFRTNRCSQLCSQNSGKFKLTCVEERVVGQRHSIHRVEADASGWSDIFNVTDPQHQIFNCVLCWIHICTFKTGIQGLVTFQQHQRACGQLQSFKYGCRCKDAKKIYTISFLSELAH